MSETDRIARMESALTGVNAWKTGWRWDEINSGLIHATPNGRARDLSVNRDLLLAFSDTLCGRHGTLLKHIRDHNPLHGEDRWSDAMLSLTRYLVERWPLPSGRGGSVRSVLVLHVFPEPFDGDAPA